MNLLLKVGLTTALLMVLSLESTAAVIDPDASALPAANVIVASNTSQSTHITISTPEIGRLEPSHRDGETLLRFGLESEPSTVRPGWPELPMVSRLVYIPATGGVQLNIHDVESYTEENFQPFIVPQQDGTVDLDLSGSPATDYPSSEGFWPEAPVTIGEPAILRGHRLVQVTIYPMQVNRSTGEVRFNTNVDFDLAYSGSGINEIQDPIRPRPSSSINRVIESLVVNPPLLSRDDHQRGSYLLVYYNANGIANALAPLITWRKRQGWEVRTMGVNVNTSANEIKNQIQRAYNEWELPPEMIAFVGDPDWASNGIPAWQNYTDQEYVRLEGNDYLSDADYGRLTCSTLQELDQVVAKIINYESNPYMDNTAWYRQGSVCAGAEVSGLSTILVNKWLRRMVLDRGWDNVHEWYFNAHFENTDVPTFFRNEFSRGINFATYRGWIGMEGLTPQMIMGFQAHRRYPFATTMTCQSGHYVQNFCQTEAFFVSPGGAIGSIGFATASTHVPYNNAVFTGIWHGLLKLGLTNLGTACNYGRYNTYRQYNGFEDQNVINFSQWANLMGDPATDMYTAIPQIVEADYPESIPLGSTRVSATILDEEDGSPVVDAQVCLFKATDDFQLVGHTDFNGNVDFGFAADALTAGNLVITATKHNMKASLGTISVGQAEQFIGAETWEISGDNNGDGNANPGEEITLNLVVKNFGTEAPQGGITISFESLSDWLTVGMEPVELQNAPEPDESIALDLTGTLNAATPDGSVHPIAVDIVSGQTTWSSMVVIMAQSPNIEVEAAFIANNRIEPGAQANIDFSLANHGNAPIEEFTAYLWSETDVVTVITDEASYPSIAVDRASRLQGNAFRIRAHPFAIPGMKAILKLEVVTASGFRDTTTFQLSVGAQRVSAPFGPDKYGYVCFDSGDRDWEMAPTYDWIEIDPQVNNNDFDGINLNLQDAAEDADRSVVVNLPFDFQYYGQSFDRGTICTNGWFAFGNWSELSDFRNRRINSGEGPDGQLCVLWEDLRTGRILTYYDEENGRFIVEWNQMRSQGDGSTQTFELVLYDTDLYPTYSGDGAIVYQYKTATNPGGEGDSHDTPYVTIGINSPSDLDGLEYTYYNSYAGGAKRLENEMAIKFTTAVQYITGVLAVELVSAATGVPIDSGHVNTARGFKGVGDQNGVVIIDEILIGDYEYLTASAQGYNDSTWFGENGEGFSIFEAETLWVTMSLLHPEFLIDRDELAFEMLPDSVTRLEMNLINGGDGFLAFTSRFTYVIEDERTSGQVQPGGFPAGLPGRDDQDEAWDMLLSWDASAPIANNRLSSIAFVKDHWVVAGGHLANREDTLNYFYEFSRSGQYTGNSYPQASFGYYGYRDMEYFDGLLYCALDRNETITAVDPADYHTVNTWGFPDELQSIRNIAIDPETGHFWVSGTTSRIYECVIENDSIMTVLRNFPTRFPDSQEQLHIYGLAWFKDDPEGFSLYIMTNHENGEDPNAEPDPEHADIALFKLHPQTGEIRYLTDLGNIDPTWQGEGGLVITPKWNNLVWGLAAVFDCPEGDQVGIFELSPNSSWISYNPREDTLASMESLTIALNIQTTDLDTGRYSVVIEFSHNADDGVTMIPVTLDVVNSLDTRPSEDPTVPAEYSLSANFPNPFNSTTVINYSLRDQGQMRLELFDITGRKIRTIASGYKQSGSHQIFFDASELSTGLYFYKLEAGSFNATRKLVIAK